MVRANYLITFLLLVVGVVPSGARAQTTAKGEPTTQPNEELAKLVEQLKGVRWNYRGIPAGRTTGRMLIGPVVEIHEISGDADGTKALLHWRDRITGMLSVKGVPLKEDWSIIGDRPAEWSKDIKLPENLPDTTYTQWIAPMDQATTEALLAGNWKDVKESLMPREDAILSPIVRLALGHAFLADGESNRALAMFGGTVFKLELDAWEKWTKDLAKANPGSALAAYYHGDALARQGKYDEAIATLTEALRQDPKLWIALDARGVAYAAKGFRDRSEADFVELTKAAPDFADGRCCLGVCYLASKSAPGALEQFKLAYHQDPSSVLALNGRGCAEYQMGDWQEAGKSFREGITRFPHAILTSNLMLTWASLEIVRKMTAEKGDAATFTHSMAAIKDAGTTAWNNVAGGSTGMLGGFDQGLHLGWDSTDGFNAKTSISSAALNNDSQFWFTNAHLSWGNTMNDMDNAVSSFNSGDNIGGVAMKKALLDTGPKPASFYTLMYPVAAASQP